MDQPTLPALHTFIQVTDELSERLNRRSNELFEKLRNLDIQATAIDNAGKQYFSAHHNGKRLFFSIESSARIIYDAVQRTGKQPEDVSFTDYGAGLGTLFLLAGMTGFKAVYYNDLFPNWTENARILSLALAIPVTDFISGDADELIQYGQTQRIHFDIIASHNVIEHIYRLRSFYAKLKASGCTSLIYSTTTANYHNPAMRIKHILFHQKVEKHQFRRQREERIRQLVPGISQQVIPRLVEITRGRAFQDFDEAVRKSMDKQIVPPVEFLGSNTCDCLTGVWAENIITKDQYREILNGAGYEMDYTPGFWDTHYGSGIVNTFTRLLNRLIGKMGSKGIALSPFVNVVAHINKP